MSIRISKKLEKNDNIESRLQNLETGEQPRDWNFYNFIWKLESFLGIFYNDKQSEENQKKSDTDPNLARDFCSTAFLSRPDGCNFFIRTFPYGCGSALGKSMTITISLITGPFDKILPCPIKGTIQISSFRQNNSGLIKAKFLKTDKKATPCFPRPLPLQPNPGCGSLFYLHYDGMFKTHKNLIRNDIVYNQMKYLNFP